MQEPIEEVSSPIPEEANGPEEVPISRQGRFARSLRRALRWLVGLLIVFGLGVLAAVVLLYLPARQQIQAAEAETGQLQQQVSALETQIAELSELENANQEILAEAERTQLHVHLLSARTDVTSALLALAQRDPARARAALSKTSDTLAALGEMLEPGQQKLASDMQERLKLALEEISENSFAAQSDLGVLMNGLLELENAYFASP